MKVRSILVAAGLLAGAICAALPAAGQPSPAAAAPSCNGPNPNVAMPNAPHGMYVWDPGERMTMLLQKYVIGKDPTLCGASIVVKWADLEKSQGVYDFSSAEAEAKPFTDAGLTVNFLFAEATEGKDEVTPAWVMSQVPTTSCGAERPLPVYWNPKFEAMWSAFVRRAIDHFSNTSPIRNQIGYLRFAVGGGAEAIAPPGAYGNGPCAKPLKALGFSYDVWKAHTLKILDVMGNAPTNHQIVVALPSIPGGKTQFEITNTFAAAAAAKHVGLSFESLGVRNIAAPGAKPGPCDPKSDLHWCAAYKKYAGVVPLAMQPITASWKTNHARIDFTNLLQYALANRIQIFELYPDEWLQAHSVKEWEKLQPGKMPKHKAALEAASKVLGQAVLK
jgi:hypothetical protein